MVEESSNSATASFEYGKEGRNLRSQRQTAKGLDPDGVGETQEITNLLVIYSRERGVQEKGHTWGRLMDGRETLGADGNRKSAGLGADGSRAAAEVGIRNFLARLRSAMDCRPGVGRGSRTRTRLGFGLGVSCLLSADEGPPALFYAFPPRQNACPRGPGRAGPDQADSSMPMLEPEGDP